MIDHRVTLVLVLVAVSSCSQIHFLFSLAKRELLSRLRLLPLPSPPPPPLRQPTILPTLLTDTYTHPYAQTQTCTQPAQCVCVCCVRDCIFLYSPQPWYAVMQRHGTIKSESKPHTSASQRPSVLALELELFQATDQAQVEVSMLESKVDAKTKLFQKKKAARDRKESQESHRLQGKPGKREGQLASSSQTLIHVPPLQGCTRQGLALVEEGVEAAEEQ